MWAPKWRGKRRSAGAEEEGRRSGAAEAEHRHGVTLHNAQVAVLLVGGGESARVDVLQAVRKGWNVVVFKGSGGFADEVECGLRQMRNGGLIGAAVPPAAAAASSSPTANDAGAVAGKIEELMKERAPMYANADVQVRLAENEDTPGTEGETLEELNVRIMRCVKARIEDDGTKDRLRSEPKPGDITITGA